MGKTMRFARVRQVLICVHGEQAPSDEDWTEWIATCAAEAPNITRLLVITDGTGPNSTQRAQVPKAGVLHIPVAVVTSSWVVRGMIAAVGWLGQKIRGYFPSELPAAFVYLDLPTEAAQQSVTRTIAELKCQLSGGSLATLERNHKGHELPLLIDGIIKEGLPDVRTGSRRPGLLVVFAGKRAAAIPVPIENGAMELGRDHPALSSRPDPSISQRHLGVCFDGRFLIADLGSRNGTTVDGAPLRPGAPREVTRVIRAGSTLLVPVQDISPVVFRGVTVIDGRVVGPTQQDTLSLTLYDARLDQTLYIIGESGTGKADLARAYHAAGPARGGPFQVVRCAALPESAVEQMLFGSGQGVGSGAQGYVRATHGGTLYLDGVAELSAAVQAKLLHLLEHGEVFPLGAGRPEKVDLRICFAAQQDLRGEVEAGRLRQDLYFRLAAPRIVLPALRERPEELSYLLETEVGRISGLSVDASLVEACLMRVWPGNVRELLAEARCAAQTALAAGAAAVDVRHLHPAAGSALRAAPASGRASAVPSTPRAASASQLRERIVAALNGCDGNVSAASRELGVHRTQLRRWLDRYGIDPRTLMPDGEI
jgi:transcriptional regulator with AAA-type ATPase domain